MSADVSGSRFMRMAGSQPFFGALNKGLQKPMQADRGGSTKMGPNTGMTTSSPKQVMPQSQTKVTPELTKDDYLSLDTPSTDASPTPSGGVGSFGKQAEREVFLKANDIGQGFDTVKATEEINNINKGLGITGGYDNPNFDVDSEIDNSVRSAIANDGLNVVALNKHIQNSILVDEAKSKLHGLNVYGDKALWSKTDLPDPKMPAPMEGVKDPDFKGMYNQITGDIKNTAGQYDDF